MWPRPTLPMRRLPMKRNADFSPQGPGTDPRAWSFRGRPTSLRSCGLKSALRVRFMAGDPFRMEHGFLMNMVAADVSPLHLLYGKTRAD